MIGYHYTTYKNWLKIQREGLKPSKFHSWVLDALKEKGSNLKEGVWLWANKPDKESHIGNLVYQLAKGEGLKIAVLEVIYANKDIHTVDRRRVALMHKGSIGSWNYHQDEKAHVIPFAIPPHRVKLIKVYDFAKALK